MAFIQENAIAKLAAGVSVNLAAAADTEVALYTVPAGKKALIFAVLAYDFSEDVNESVVTIGKTGGTCDEFLGNQTLTNISASYADQCLTLMPVPAATTVAGLVLDAGESLGCEITTAETTGTATCKMMVLGIELDA